MPRPLAPLATSLPTILTVPEGREAGLSRARLRAPDLVAIGHGLRMSRDVEATWTDYLRAVQSLNPSGVFSHATAARIVVDQQVLRGDEVLFSARVTIVSLDGRGRPVRLPAALSRALPEG